MAIFTQKKSKDASNYKESYEIGYESCIILDQ